MATRAREHPEGDDRLAALYRAAVGQTCPTCGYPVRHPWVVLVHAGTVNGVAVPEYSAVYCSRRCGGSWFTP